MGDTKTLDRVVLTRGMVGICHMQVCAVKDATDEEILAVCNRLNPSGTTHGWSSVCHDNSETFGATAPKVCADDPERIHYLVAC